MRERRLYAPDDERPMTSAPTRWLSRRAGVASFLTSGALALLGALSCQAIFGDYRIDASQVPPPPVVCERGDTRCRGRILEECAPDRLAWQTLETCGTEALCNLAMDSCDECTPTEYQCNDRELRRCTDARTWEVQDTCATPELCWTNAERTMGTCNLSACTVAGEYKCVDARLQRCARGLHRWEDVEICDSAELCLAALDQPQGVGQQPLHCPRAECREGEFFCDETGRLGKCAASRLTWDPVGMTNCDPPQHCNIKAGNCSPCTSGEFACSGPDLRRCTPAGTWERVELCGSAALCNAAAGTCDPPGCATPGALMCDPDRLELRRCPADQTSEQKLAQCRIFALCNAEELRCELPACKEGSNRCVGSRLETCSDDLTGWLLAEQCSLGTSCDPVLGCVPGTCQNGSTRCNDRYLEKCENGAWQRMENCQTPELCNVTEGRCESIRCAPAERRCQPDMNAPETLENLMVCDPGRHQFVKLLDCPKGTCDASSGSCL